MEISKSNTNLPIKGRIPITKPGDEPILYNRLGMIFNRPPFSELTSEHGFLAILQTPYVRLPAEDLAGPILSNPEQDSEALEFLRFKTIKEEQEKNTNYKYKKIRCVVDLSTHMTFALHSAVGLGSKLKEPIQPEVLALGDFQIDDKEFILGSQNIRFFIHKRPYIQEAIVVKELFPGHKGINIQMVLGKNFLNNYPGFVLQPVLCRESIDFVPWDFGSGGNWFNINSKGELMVYICGHSEITPLESCLDISKDHKNCNHETGGYGVFFGPYSGYNISLPSKMKGSPKHEAALMEGIIAVADILVDGGHIYGTPTFTSIRILTDSQLIVDLLNPGGTLKEYRKRRWKNKQGKRIGFWEALRYWNNDFRKGMMLRDVVWWKKDIFIFEKVGKKTKGLQAARHLAQCGQKYSKNYFCDKDFGDAQTSERYSKKQWEKSEYCDILYISTPHTYYGTNMAKQQKIDFLNSRIKVNSISELEKAGTWGSMVQNASVIHPTPSSATKTHIASFFPSRDPFKFESFASKLANSHKYSVMKVLEMLDSSFLKEVLRITKEKRGLENTLEFFKEENGSIHFFHKGPKVAESNLINTDDSSSESSYSDCSLQIKTEAIKDVNSGGKAPSRVRRRPGNLEASRASVGNTSVEMAITKDTDTKDASSNNTDAHSRLSSSVNVRDTNLGSIEINAVIGEFDVKQDMN